MVSRAACDCCAWHGSGGCACHGMPVPRSLEDQAEDLARRIARGGLPPDAGAIAKLRGLVSDARQHGRDAATAEAREYVREWAEQF